MSTLLTILQMDGTELEHALELRTSRQIRRGDELMIFFSHYKRKAGKTCIHFLPNGKKPQGKAFVNFGEFGCPQNVTVTNVHQATIR